MDGGGTNRVAEADGEWSLSVDESILCVEVVMVVEVVKMNVCC